MSGGASLVGCLSGIRWYRIPTVRGGVPLSVELIRKGGIGIPAFFRALLWTRFNGSTQKGGITRKFQISMVSASR